ncbi:MAG: hydroxymethylglutaryl-CoA reductase, degradative [Chloroflexi bacterium CFX1]|nr:hydroxymethylglutaryl-CoA reductase, degradative [Chloroflexi bacterium CFX1]MCK6568582.1 hydroxymethylglutaryl-CoA reductase, degradative [Anaerolineales bacterium]MDL1920400.1 hydroxymethylglutaryl-CoA reductase, degradative [Chloroflexi bacterium CFX5]NUQ58944.1 hydroxymethylglutaryl-CoA reductase, degradative [Anaerolineales bacterium]
MTMTSRIPHFYNMTIEERRQKISDAAALPPPELGAWTQGGLSAESADPMIENVVGLHSLPLGIALNFQVNGRDILIPMTLEEPSVVAGASFMAKLARAGGGFHATTTDPLMIGQMQVINVVNLNEAKLKIYEKKAELLAEADSIDPILKKFGGGARDLEVRIFDNSPIGGFLVVHLIYDVRDAMGANAVNTACERLAPKIEAITGGKVHLRILSNLADRRIARARCTIPVKELAFESVGQISNLPNGQIGNLSYTGEQVRDGIIAAYAFAAVDPYRAATHNKGIMNGVDSVVIATGNDWRAIEAGAHAYAARSGRYTSLSTWGKDNEGNLVGTLEMPMAVGIVGGATKVHPAAQAAVKLMGVKTANELAEIIVSVGLAQNMAALRALATEGIQRGHMSLHARQVAIAAGANGELIEKVAAQMVAERIVRIDRAEEIMKSLESGK